MNRTRTILTALLTVAISVFASAADHNTRLVICGDSSVHIISPERIADGGNYTDGLDWSVYSPSFASQIGIDRNHILYIDECKPIADGRKLLITSSAHWTVILDIMTRQVEFFSNKCNNAHSAEILPGNLLAVACSSPKSAIQLYSLDRPNEILQEDSLYAAHGAVYMPETQLLYTIGHNMMHIYRIDSITGTTPRLEPVQKIKMPLEHAHDLSRIDSSTLCVSGIKSCFYDIPTGKFTELPMMSDRWQLKAVNYNPATDEMWYTDATRAEGTYGWSTQTIHYNIGYDAKNDKKTIKTPGLDMYKVRVLHW